MSQGPENRFITSIHKKLPPSVYRMKNHNQYTGGIPDCWYSGTAGDLWIEYKYGKNKLSALQKDWIEARRNEGRRVWVVTGAKDSVVINTDFNKKYEIDLITTKVKFIEKILGVTIGATGTQIKKHRKRNKLNLQNHNHRTANL